MRKKLSILTIICLSIFVVLSIILMNRNDESIRSESEKGINIVDISGEIEEVGYEKIYDKNDMKTVLAKLEDGTPWFPLRITNDGIIYGQTANTGEKNSSIIIYDINTEIYEVFYTVQDDLYPTSLEFNDNYIAWIESFFDNGDCQTRIQLYDKSNKKVTTIIDEKGKYLSNRNISLGKNYLLWSDYEVVDEKTEYFIMKYNIETKEISKYMDDANSPMINNNILSYIGPNKDTDSMSSIYSYDMEEKSEIVVPNEGNPIYFSTNGDEIVNSGIDKNSLDNDGKFGDPTCYLAFYSNNQNNIIQISSADRFEFPLINDNIITWSPSDKVKFYDRNRNKIIVLSTDYPEYADFKISDNYILWNSPKMDGDENSTENITKNKMYTSYIHVLKYK